MSKRQSILSLLTELIETSIKQNYSERLQAHQREIDLLKGNLEESDKRFKALVDLLQVEYITTRKYRKKKL